MSVVPVAAGNAEFELAFAELLVDGAIDMVCQLTTADAIASVSKAAAAADLAEYLNQQVTEKIVNQNQLNLQREPSAVVLATSGGK